MNQESLLVNVSIRAIVDSIKGMGANPPVMFDIDNFPEFSSRRDGDPEGEGSLGKSNCCVRKESSQGRA
jgi:hypothetical protein